MKELQLHNKDKVVLSAQAEQQTRQIHVARVTPHNGHKLFEYNTKMNILRYADFETVNADYTAASRGQIAKNKKVLIKTDCLYITALNFTNASRKFVKRIKTNIVPIIEGK